MRIHGAAGYSKAYPIERSYRDAPPLCIGEGTNEIQRLIICWRWYLHSYRERRALSAARRIARVRRPTVVDGRP